MSQSSDVRKTIVELVEQRYPGCAFALFYGSRQRNIARPDSDLDMMVVFDRPLRPFRESFKHANIVFDVFVYDQETLHCILTTARSAGGIAMLDIVANAEALPSATATSNFLINLARQQQSSPQPDVGPKNVEALRVYFTNLLKDVANSEDRLESNALCCDLHKSITELFFMKHGRIGNLRKYVPRVMRELEPHYAERLDHALVLAISGSDSRALVELGTEALMELGGPLACDFRIPLAEARRLPLPDSF